MTVQTANTYPPGPRLRFPWRQIGRLPSELPTVLQDMAQKYGDITHFSLGGRHFYLLNHPDFIQEVLINQAGSFIKGQVVQRNRQFLGTSLLTSQGETHLHQRRLLQPCFRRENLQQYSPVIVKLADQMSQRWQAGQPLNLAHEMTHLTMDFIARVLFGASIEQHIPQLNRAIQTILARYQRGFSFTGLIRTALFQTRGRREQQAQAQLEAFIRTMMGQRNGDNNDTFLSEIIKLNDGDAPKFSEQQIKDHILTLFLAGHETTASALSWTFYLLAQYPQATEKLTAELDSCLGGCLPSAEHYPQLAYAKMTLSESMRLYPPAWILGRETTEPVSLGGYRLPSGATVLLSQWITHRDPRYYPNPNLFKPERWLPKARSTRPKMAYFPFGGGQHLCIGEQLAWLVGTLTIATVLQKWQFEPLPGRRMLPDFTLTLRPGQGECVRPIPR